ncbi:hypothetical protein [Amycolatopsis benzoatilytica]|uniref:hypothetical protein n=1 Tax=Amycolatopsis benzoatilytica TaxID=346045 RepID=UPI00037C7F82|nr:hypothetical protein [Amycolatopsis benzoatilytica]
MRWLILYARSRHVAVSLPAAVLCAAVLPALLRDNWSTHYATLALAAAIAVAAVGLSGQDIDLDRTAGVPWPPRRLAHLLLIGVAAAGILLAAQGVIDVAAQATPAWTLRNTAGLLGLTGLAATLFGGQLGWTLPLAWPMVSLFAPATEPPALGAVIAWLTTPAGTPTAWWTAGILFAAGTATYAARGARR